MNFFYLKKFSILVVSSNFFFAGIIGQIATALLLQRCRRRRKRSSRRWARPSLYSLTPRRRSAMTMDTTWMTMAALVEEVIQFSSGHLWSDGVELFFLLGKHAHAALEDCIGLMCGLVRLLLDCQFLSSVAVLCTLH